MLDLVNSGQYNALAPFIEISQIKFAISIGGSKSFALYVFGPKKRDGVEYFTSHMVEFTNFL